MKKIVFVVPKLGGGGSERVVSTILRYIDKETFDVYLLIIHENGEYEKFLSEEIKIRKLPVSKVRFAAFSLIKEIKKINPDIIFSSLRGMSTILGLIKFFLPKETKMIFRENNSPSVSIADSKFPLIWKMIYKFLIRNIADIIICQSEYMVDDFNKNFSFNKNQLVRIYNPVDIELIKKLSNEGLTPFQEAGYKNVVVVAKMMPQKGIDILLKSIAKYKKRTNKIKIWIIGEGKYFKNYIQLTKKLKITDKVNFIGRQENPFIWMKHSDLVILPSRYEGLPNVVLEAIACGCKVIVTDHPGGTREIMEMTNRSGNIVKKLDWDPKWFETINESPTNFEEIFGVENIIKQYEKVFIELTNS